MDRITKQKLESLDDFYLVEIIKDQEKFGYDAATVAQARRVLKGRGFSRVELEGLYQREVEPQDRETREAVLSEYWAFVRQGILFLRIMIPLFILGLGSLFLHYSLSGHLKEAAFLTDSIILFGPLNIAAMLVFPLCSITGRGGSRGCSWTALTIRPAGTCPLYLLDDGTWDLLLWFLAAPGYLCAWRKTRSKLVAILKGLGYPE